MLSFKPNVTDNGSKEQISCSVNPAVYFPFDERRYSGKKKSAFAERNDTIDRQGLFERVYFKRF